MRAPLSVRVSALAAMPRRTVHIEGMRRLLRRGAGAVLEVPTEDTTTQDSGSSPASQAFDTSAPASMHCVLRVRMQRCSTFCMSNVSAVGTKCMRMGLWGTT